MEEKIAKKIESLRAKPQHVKERILIVCMAIAVALLLTFWVSTFSSPITSESGSGFVSVIKNIFKSSGPTIAPLDPTKVPNQNPEAGPVSQ